MKSTVLIILISALKAKSVELDLIDCGIDNDIDVFMGNVTMDVYPWLGILYYTYRGEIGETRATTMVALIQAEFVIAAAADIGPMPKHDFRRNTRVLLGEKWGLDARRVRNYVLHPEYEETMNTVALVQLRDPVGVDSFIKPLCPPPELLRNPDFYLVTFDSDYTRLQKKVIKMTHVPGTMCKEFYVRSNLYSKKMRPPYVACAVSLEEESVCVWEAGAALVTKDVWGRWALLGLGVRGPGCGAPSRYLDMMSYYPWIKHSLSKFQRITISKISNQKYVLRASGGPDVDGSEGGGTQLYSRYGNCDPEEKVNLVYRDLVVLRSDNPAYQFLTYNMTIKQDVEYSCLTLELVNASAVSQMKITHICPRVGFARACYRYQDSEFSIAVFITFTDQCLFEMVAWGWQKNMTLLDIQEWKWEEGTYYEDFSMKPTEYRGPTYQTLFGFEPLDEKKWVPEYDVWTTTQVPTSPTTTLMPMLSSSEEREWILKNEFWFITTSTSSPPRAFIDPPAPVEMFNIKQVGKNRTFVGAGLNNPKLPPV